MARVVLSASVSPEIIEDLECLAWVLSKKHQARVQASQVARQAIEDAVQEHPITDRERSAFRKLDTPRIRSKGDGSAQSFAVRVSPDVKEAVEIVALRNDMSPAALVFEWLKGLTQLNRKLLSTKNRREWRAAKKERLEPTTRLELVTYGLRNRKPPNPTKAA